MGLREQIEAAVYEHPRADDQTNAVMGVVEARVRELEETNQQLRDDLEAATRFDFGNDSGMEAGASSGPAPTPSATRPGSTRSQRTTRTVTPLWRSPRHRQGEHVSLEALAATMTATATAIVLWVLYQQEQRALRKLDRD